MLKLAAKKKVAIASALFSPLILFGAVSCGFCSSASVDTPEVPANPIAEGSADKPETSITPIKKVASQSHNERISDDTGKCFDADGYIRPLAAMPDFTSPYFFLQP